MIIFEQTETQKKILEMCKNWAPEYILEWLDGYMWRPAVRSMLKYKIPDDLLDEMDDYSETLRNDQILHGDLDTNEKIKYAKAILKEHKLALKTFSTDIYSELINAVKEVADDVKFVKSKNGKLILVAEVDSKPKCN